MSHFYCDDCGRSDAYPTTMRAKTDGWEDLDAEGSAGATDGLEYTGLCPDCSAERR